MFHGIVVVADHLRCRCHDAWVAVRTRSPKTEEGPLLYCTAWAQRLVFGMLLYSAAGGLWHLGSASVSSEASPCEASCGESDSAAVRTWAAIHSAVLILPLLPLLREKGVEHEKSLTYATRGLVPKQPSDCSSPSTCTHPRDAAGRHAVPCRTAAPDDAARWRLRARVRRMQRGQHSPASSAARAAPPPPSPQACANRHRPDVASIIAVGAAMQTLQRPCSCSRQRTSPNG